MTVTAIIDHKPAVDLLNRIIAACGDAKPAMSALSLSLEQRIKDGFTGQVDPWGNPWARHSQVTIDRRKKDTDKSAIKILEDSGDMLNSIASSISDDSLDIWIRGPQANAMQFGNPDNRMFGKALAPIPARPFMPIRPDGNADLPPDWLQEMVDVLTAHLVPA